MENMTESALTLMSLIQKAKENGIDTEEHDELMEKGLTDEQKTVVENRVGEGRIRLTGKRPQTDEGGVSIPTLLDKIAKQQKIPWIITLDGVDFVVKTSIGEQSYPHSKWEWQENGYRFIFYKSRTEDTVHSIEICNI